MEIDLSYLTNILTSPPGNLLYHLVISLAFVLISGLAIPGLNLANSEDRARHILVGCSTLLLIHIVLFAASLVQGLTPFSLALLESLASTLMIIWLFWIFHEEDPNFFLTGVNIFLTLALFIISTIILIMTNLGGTQGNFDPNMVIISWQLGAILLIALGLVLTFLKRPPQWVIAVCIMLVLASGHALEIILIDSLALKLGAVRLAQILSLPWTIVIVQRFSKSQSDKVEIRETPKMPSEEQRVDTKPTLIEYLLSVPLQKTQQDKFKAVARALSLGSLADICCILKLNEEADTFEMIAGYDLIREVFLDQAVFPTDSLPHILKTWQENRILKLSRSFTEGRDFETLTELINYPHLGNMFAYPLPSDEEPLAGGVILLTPYTERIWQNSTTSLFDQIRPTLSRVLFTPSDIEQLQIELSNAEEKIQQLINHKESLQADLVEKEFTIENLESALKQWKARFQIEKLESVNRIEKLQEQIDQFSAQPEDRSDISSKLEQMAAKIRQLTSERDQLKKELAKAEARINTLNIEKGQTGPIRLSMETQVVSLDSILANVRLKIASQLAALSIDLEIVNPDGHQMIKVDPELTQATIFGLLDNAIKASSPGGKVQVNQKLSLETGMLIIQITDYGEGLTPEEQKSLFSAEPEMNPGIGSIQSIREAIRAIRVLNGKIWLKSKKGEFTTFRVQLPVRIID